MPNKLKGLRDGVSGYTAAPRPRRCRTCSPLEITRDQERATIDVTPRGAATRVRLCERCVMTT